MILYSFRDFERVSKSYLDIYVKPSIPGINLVLIDRM